MHAMPLEQTAASGVGAVLDRPEEAVVGARAVSLAWLAAGTAVGGAAFGAAVHVDGGVVEMVRGAVVLPAVLSVAFALALPALFVFATALGSRLSASATLRAVLVAGWATGISLLAGVPVVLFFALVSPGPHVNPVAVGCLSVMAAGSGADVFLRTTRALDPERDLRFDRAWLVLVAVLAVEMFNAVGLFG